ncbi:hypothetical protein QOZ80_2BG0202660 [Eleusine coracana subsp. coracana]|nr:hypothetical protein QOZ80_2BG0202660 [Eleusine coracana subsp. coracana]
MGKTGEADQAAPRPSPVTSSGGFSGCWYGAAVCKIVNAKCVSVLLLAVGGFLSALFLLLHLRVSGAIPDDPGILAEIQAGFILLMPYSEVASHVKMLERDIYKKIGVPNSKVSVSMGPYKYTNSTYVAFGILPDPRNSSINPASMSRLRNSLIQLTLQQSNLSLTPSVFGDPFCLEILGFPGGITVLLPFSNFHPDSIVQPLFNITLDLTIHQIREFLEEMKIELASTLKQMPDEELFIKLTNMNGSTVAVPVSVQVSLSSNDHSIYLEPGRLQQLAQIVTDWNLTNLGLNLTIFGKIRDLKVYPVLQEFMPACAPSLPPASTPSISRPPSWDRNEIYPKGSFSCPAFMNKQYATIPHRRLSTRFHRKSRCGARYHSGSNNIDCTSI